MVITKELDAFIRLKYGEFVSLKYRMSGNSSKEEIDNLYPYVASPIELLTFAILYAKERGFVEAEENLASDPFVAYRYAVKVINKRFIAGESLMKTIPKLWEAYSQQFSINNGS